MSVLPNSETKTEFSIHPATRIGHVSLNVANLEDQLAFYQQALGFHLHWRDGNKAGLGAGDADLLQLVEQPDYKRYQRITGLYHLAVLFPDRRELARAIARLFVLKYPNSPTDHIMTKTTYLDDMEGNGIELYTESPEDGTWTLKDGILHHPVLLVIASVRFLVTAGHVLDLLKDGPLAAGTSPELLSLAGQPSHRRRS